MILYQFVTLFEGGEARKMSTRRGEFVTQDELVDDVGADVVRYFILARSPNSHLEFDLDLARKQANENPVYYIQNAHVRCAGIFRQAAERGLTDDGADLSLLGARERDFVRKMLEMPRKCCCNAMKNSRRTSWRSMRMTWRGCSTPCTTKCACCTAKCRPNWPRPVCVCMARRAWSSGGC